MLLNSQQKKWKNCLTVAFIAQKQLFGPFLSISVKFIIKIDLKKILCCNLKVKNFEIDPIIGKKDIKKKQYIMILFTK